MNTITTAARAVTPILFLAASAALAQTPRTTHIAALPSTCRTDEVYFVDSAPSGQNVFACTSTNIFTQLAGGSGGGAGMASQLGDFSYTKTSSTTASIGQNCSLTTPCLYRFGSVYTAVTAPATMTISGTSSTDTVFVYISADNTPALTVGYSGAETITCTGCLAAPGVTGFPLDGSAIPLFSIGIASNAFVNTATDARSVYSKEFIQPAQGIVISPNPFTGAVTVQVDSTVVPRYFAGSGAPTFNCIVGRDFYTDTTNLNPYFCDSVNTWKQIGIQGVNTVSFSAAPTFNLALGDQFITLTGNVTSPNVTNITPGQRVTFTICQDATGARTFSWPSGFHGAMTVGGSPSTCSSQQFESPNGSQLYATAPGVVNQ